MRRIPGLYVFRNPPRIGKISRFLLVINHILREHTHAHLVKGAARQALQCLSPDFLRLINPGIAGRSKGPIFRPVRIAKAKSGCGYRSMVSLPRLNAQKASRPQNPLSGLDTVLPYPCVLRPETHHYFPLIHGKCFHPDPGLLTAKDTGYIPIRSLPTLKNAVLFNLFHIPLLFLLHIFSTPDILLCCLSTRIKVV